MPIPDPAYLYHITHVDNLAGIIRAGGLLANGQVGDAYVNIAHSSIQMRRHTRRVPCGPGGVLHDYAPFYFGRLSPMLFTISKGNVAGYEEGQEPVVYLVTTVAKVVEAGIPFVFTDGHAAMELSDFYADPARLDQVDWPLMKERYWNDTEQDMDRKRRRQAEFLVHGICPWELFLGIVTMTEPTQARVEAILNQENPAHRPKTKTIRNWYY